MPDRKARCHYDDDRGWLTPEHLRDCDDHDCAGCRPCGKDHCDLRGRCPNHVSHGASIYTCPACIGRVRRDLDTVEQLFGIAGTLVESRTGSSPLLDGAEDDGIDSEAFNLAGPAAEPDRWAARRRRMQARDEMRGWCDYPRHETLNDDDKHHPYAVLGRWDLALRELYGPPTGLIITVSRAADYLRGLLDGPFPHEDQFPDFATEIATCRTHLEATLHDSRVPEQGRPCPRCAEDRGKAPRLRKRYAAHPGLPAGMLCGAKDGSQGEILPCSTCDGQDDTWHCPDVAAHWWTERDYRDRVASDYRAHANALTAADIAAEYGIKPATLRKRAERDPKIRRGRNQFGQQLYDVARATEPERIEA